MDSTPAPGTPILSDRPGSFPWTVLHDRHPALLRQVLDAHPYPPGQRAAIERLGLEISGPIEPLTDHADDVRQWTGWAAGYLGRSWYDVPFLWAENYFYRKLLAAVGQLGPGPWQGIDPFAPLKDVELAGQKVDDELLALEGLPGLPAEERLDTLLLAALWGNRADLGFLIQPGPQASGRQASGRQASGRQASGRQASGRQASGPVESGPATDGRGVVVDHLVADDRELLHRILSTARGTVVLVADNAGRELLPDLVLIDHLLAAGVAEVVLHVKPRPYFVSDATTADVLAALRRLGTGPAVASGIGHRLETALRVGTLSIRADPFSVAPFGYHDLPPGLRSEFAAADLTVMKGDLNYRRLVGDRHWPAETPFAELTGYFPSPVVALRTLKSEVVVGLDAPTLAALGGTGTRWRTSGEYGLIQVRA